MDFNGHTVWVTVRRPAIFDKDTNQYTEEKYISAFMIGDEPGFLDGEYVKENGKLKFFDDHMTALCAAFATAREKIHS